jgi:hypothetical protein
MHKAATFQINNDTFLEAFMSAKHSTAPSDAGKPQKPYLNSRCFPMLPGIGRKNSRRVSLLGKWDEPTVP